MFAHCKECHLYIGYRSSAAPRTWSIPTRAISQRCIASANIEWHSLLVSHSIRLRVTSDMPQLSWLRATARSPGGLALNYARRVNSLQSILRGNAQSAVRKATPTQVSLQSVRPFIFRTLANRKALPPTAVPWGEYANRTRRPLS